MFLRSKVYDLCPNSCDIFLFWSSSYLCFAPFSNVLEIREDSIKESFKYRTEANDRFRGKQN